MKLRKGWEITTAYGDVYIITDGHAQVWGNLRWAKKFGYAVKRILILS